MTKGMIGCLAILTVSSVTACDESPTAPIAGPNPGRTKLHETAEDDHVPTVRKLLDIGDLPGAPHREDRRPSLVVSFVPGLEQNPDLTLPPCYS